MRIQTRVLLILQLAGTVAIIGWVPSSLFKLIALLALWSLTFQKIGGQEVLLYFLTCLFFTAMDIFVVGKGAFAFRRPDIFGLPLYEPFMWGFYVLHAVRFLGVKNPDGNKRLAWALLSVFILPFAFPLSHSLRSVISWAMLLVCLAFYHEPSDLAYVGYMILVGTLIEFAGVLGGEWRYMDFPAGRVPLWYAPMWGGTGLFLRRAILPAFLRSRRPPAGATA